MARRVIGWLNGVLHHPEPAVGVHFHQGTDSHTPAVCYDAHCTSPRLDPETAY